MKSIEQIIKEYNQNELLAEKVESADDPRLHDIIAFYEKYPQYSELNANGVFFVLASIRTKKKPVKVYKFLNGDILFVGDIITVTNAPIAGIGGNGLPLPPGFDWNNIEQTSKGIMNFVEEITWNF